MKTTLLLAWAIGARALCMDDPTFLDENGMACATYAPLGGNCLTAAGLSSAGLQRVLASCGLTCGSCVRASDFCKSLISLWS